MVIDLSNATATANRTRGGDIVQNISSSSAYTSSTVNLMGNSEEGDYVHGFEEYPQTSVDPGSSFLVATILFCVLSQLLLPWLVMLDRRHRKRSRKKKKEKGDKTHDESMDVQLEVQEEQVEVTYVTPLTGLSKPEKLMRTIRKGQRCRRGGRNWVAFGDGISYRNLDSPMTEEDSEGIEMKPSNKTEDTFIDEDSTHLGDVFNKSSCSDTKDNDDTILNLWCGQNAWWKPATISQAFRYVRTLATDDKETRSIIKLAIPYSFSAVMEAVFEAIGIGIVGHYLGTDALVAYSVVDVIISISSELVGGVIDTEASL
eukprot:scaffold144346_cov60-Attheya_sp.AAC.1